MTTSVLFAVATARCGVVSGMHPARADLATIKSTCRAAHAADSIVKLIFCRRRLAAHRDAANADVPGSPGSRLLSRDARFRAALEQCDRLFGSIRGAFAAAAEAVVDRRYAAVQGDAVGVPRLGHDCGSAFHSWVGLSPLTNFSVHNTGYAHICIAITSLINIK
ncbi:hypothetical protein ACP70R_013366 [Stipagrostis hirtigluma subsp. patula]